MKWKWLTLILLIILGLRLFFAFQTPFYSTDISYLQTRIVENIATKFTPFFHDTLGWDGRTLYANLFHYILAFFSLFLPEFIVFKIIPNIIATLTVIPVFLIINNITKKQNISLFCAFLSGIVPVFFIHTFNTISNMNLVIPLFFFLIYTWLKIPSKTWTVFYVLSIILFSFLHPLSIVFVIGLFFYIILLKLAHLKTTTEEFELFIFSVFFVFWAQFLIFKNIILFHGFQVFWQNIPFIFLSERFFRLPIWGIVLEIGLLPLLAGIFIFYKQLFKNKTKYIYLFFSFASIIFLFQWLLLIELFYGLMIIGIILIILFGKWLTLFNTYLKKTNIIKLRKFFFYLVCILVVFTSLATTITGAKFAIDKTISKEEINAYTWLKNNTDPDSRILSPVTSGFYISTISNRTAVIDPIFLLQTRGNERFKDTKRIYSSILETEVVNLLTKYNIDYIIVSEGHNDIVFTNNICFEKVYNNTIKIFKKDKSCQLQVIK